MLGLCCRTLLMERCPDIDEGQLSRRNSLLVSGASNARYAAYLGLDRYLLLEPRALRQAVD